VVSFTSQPLYLRGKNFPVRFGQEAGCAQEPAGSSGKAKNSHHCLWQELNTGRPASSLVCILTELLLLYLATVVFMIPDWRGDKGIRDVSEIKVINKINKILSFQHKRCTPVRIHTVSKFVLFSDILHPSLVLMFIHCCTFPF
jgi:hypothetical protein